MRSAIYIQEGTLQFVLTAESTIDEQVLSALEKAQGLKVLRGSFYETTGGWVRYREGNQTCYDNQWDRSDYSLIFRVDEPRVVEEPMPSTVSPSPTPSNTPGSPSRP